MFVIILTLAIIFVSILLYSKNKQPAEKILGVYSQPGKWYYLKYIVFRSLLTVRRLKVVLLGKNASYPEDELEKLKPLSNHEKAFDAVFFQAVEQNGISFCGGIERRHNSKANGLFYILVPELGLLESSKLPNTVLDADVKTVLHLKEYAAEGISFYPVTPMKHWKVSFNGKMRLHNDRERLVDVKLEGDWTSDFPWFIFEVDMSSTALAKAFARETWTREYFQALKDAHQSHYEQMGYLNGSLIIDGKKYKLQMDAFRDHSFGFKRDWSLMHRYIFHMFYLVDGTRVSIGVISQPSTSSHLEMGYILHPNGIINAIDGCDLLLYQHGEDGLPPKEIAFTFTADSKVYEVKVKYEVDAVHFKGNDIEAKLHERFISCEVNGVKGRGISEWHYNNIKE